jgi:hypothetical protein
MRTRPSPDAQSGLQRIGEPAGDTLAHRQPIDHHLDGVFAVLGEFRRCSGLHHLAVHPGADESLLDHLLEQLSVFALAPGDPGCQHHEPGALGQGQHPVHHLLHGLGLDGNPMVRTVGHAHRRPQQAQVVVDFGHRADGGAGVAGGGLLFDGDGRRETLDGVHIGLFHLIQKLPCVGRQTLDIAPLTLGEERVERQGGFARTRDAGDHHQAVAGQAHVDVGQVVFAGSANHDVVEHRSILKGVWAAAPRA